jgi:ketosteroid isomerase-like protein
MGESDNVEVVRSLYELLDRRDIDAYMERFADDVVWIEPEGSEFGGTYHGKETVRELMTSTVAEWWEEFHVDIDRFIDAGDTVVAIGTERGVYRDTDAEMAAKAAHVYDLEDGKVVRMESFVDSAKMQAAVNADTTELD